MAARKSQSNEKDRRDIDVSRRKFMTMATTGAAAVAVPGDASARAAWWDVPRNGGKKASSGLFKLRFCHAAGTMIRMEDGTLKAIESLVIGDRVFLGGMVCGRGEAITVDLYHYKGTTVTGSHPVFEDCQWLIVQDSRYAERVEGQAVIYYLCTEEHLLVFEQYIGTDYLEVNDDIGATARLQQLNADVARNRRLGEIERTLGSLRIAA